VGRETGVGFFCGLDTACFVVVQWGEGLWVVYFLDLILNAV
jgi:hypothetical protein